MIDGSFEVRWREPVWLKVGYGFPEAVRGPRQALNYLTFRWPAPRGTMFEEAEVGCKSALRKELGCEVARQAFVLAAEEAGMVA
jgi:hypothetical protein